MATVKGTPRSAAGIAASRLRDAELEATLRGEEPRYGPRAAIVPADLATPDLIRDRHADGWPVVVVDADGSERFLPVPQVP